MKVKRVFDEFIKSKTYRFIKKYKVKNRLVYTLILQAYLEGYSDCVKKNK